MSGTLDWWIITSGGGKQSCVSSSCKFFKESYPNLLNAKWINSGYESKVFWISSKFFTAIIQYRINFCIY